MFGNMGDEFRGGVCGGTRWNIPATTTPFGFSPCLAGSTDLEPFDWNMKRIFSKSINNEDDDIHSHVPDSGFNDGGHIVNSSINMFGMEAMEDWKQTFNVNNNMSNNLQEEQQQDNSFKSFSLEESNINAFNNPISYGYSSTLLQTLFEDDPQELSVFENQTLPMNYPCPNNSQLVSPSMPKLPFDPSIFSDQAPSLWSPSDIRANFFPSLSCPKITAPKVASQSSNGLSWSSTMRKNINNDQKPLKRPRIETPSPLPTFKVRKEKLGDRITALQQLVSPFGKTDTASVLHEAIDYIKFLHDQVNVLSSPYLRNGKPTIQKHGQKNESLYSQEAKEGNSKQDLKSRGLCLVPLSSTIPIAIETTRAADFWTPNFGGAFK
ncbi:transcription factor bHLH112-like isoform X2 [Impatiens glandulifera]|uniref:transcription factor bHLH112-like isoform X2 n=1 Tax=Impatiens glandulifera TaxID=253017 RepID=UPI001FB167CA|nr:transcription factor bHLH112-like isoform X2 [Impatiens glandulifera]